MASSSVAAPKPGALTGAVASAPPEDARPKAGGNTLGRVVCLTLFTPVRPQWAPVLKALFWIATHLKFASKDVLQFNFIHYVRWAVFRDIAYNGPPQHRDRLNYSYLFFESNFDGPWQHYIDAFAYCIPFDIRLVWGRGIAFPGPPPSEPLKAWIAANSMEGGTYYCAYPEASTRMVQSAVVVRDKLRALVARSYNSSPDEFMKLYEKFLTDVQAHL